MWRCHMRHKGYLGLRYRESRSGWLDELMYHCHAQEENYLEDRDYMYLRARRQTLCTLLGEIILVQPAP